MVRRTEGASSHQAGPFAQDAAHGVNLGRLDRLGKTQWGKNGRNAFGHHGLARAWRSNHQDVVAASSRHFQSTLGV